MNTHKINQPATLSIIVRALLNLCCETENVWSYSLVLMALSSKNRHYSLHEAPTWRINPVREFRNIFSIPWKQLKIHKIKILQPNSPLAIWRLKIKQFNKARTRTCAVAISTMLKTNKQFCIWFSDVIWQARPLTKSLMVNRII